MGYLLSFEEHLLLIANICLEIGAVFEFCDVDQIFVIGAWALHTFKLIIKQPIKLNTILIRTEEALSLSTQPRSPTLGVDVIHFGSQYTSWQDLAVGAE